MSKPNKYKGLLLLTIFCLTVSACKLDKPVLPGDVNYVATPDPNAVGTDVVLGTTTTGTTVNNANLTATWKAVSTTQQFYNINNVVVSGSTIPNMFTTVTLKEPTKTAVYVGLTNAAANQTYALSAANNVLYLQLSADPFARSNNDAVRITNLTATAMTWVAVDPTMVLLGGQLLHTAYQVTFSK